MTEYYTTESLTTAMIAIDCGFEKCESYIQHRLKDYPATWHEGLLLGGRKYQFLKTSHNMRLMKHKVGDYVMAKSNTKINGIVARIENDALWLNVPCGIDSETGEWLYCNDMFGMTKKEAVILLRNGLPFPVWDKEKM